ncbi:putative cullin binding protein [Phaeomoniella chlamydospora]|uniref:Putative cullin binding protein n=1 Tax=Phaeomoniella chlamydospora TaxID=158046 RepID=A0A0G2HHM3_PHACM|nr:putative cullin binding protein [Phaeomoniella chlamydospora]
MAKDRQSAHQGLTALLPKLNDPDPDIRFMSLSDLANILASPASAYIHTEPHTAARIVEGLLKSLQDPNGEVQNQALKCMGPLASRIPYDVLPPLIDKLVDLTVSLASGTDVSNNAPGTALRTLISNLPLPTTAGATAEAHASYRAISKILIPRLVGDIVMSNQDAPRRPPKGILEPDAQGGYSTDAVDTLIEVAKCYGPLLQDAELSALSKMLMGIIEAPQASSVAKKRALTAIATLLPYFGDMQLSSFVSSLIESFRTSHLTADHRRYLIATIGSLARSAPRKIGPYLKTLAPFVLSALSEQEIEEMAEDTDDTVNDGEADELRETALVALECLIGSCGEEMQPYAVDAVSASLRYIKYDPNMAESDDEDMGGTQDADSDDGITEEAEDEDQYDDFEEEESFSDVDDISWKVRRCAAKVIYVLISGSITLDDKTTYHQIAPALIARITTEREENVKIEILSGLTALIRKTGQVAVVLETQTNGDLASSPPSRKRRRQSSTASLEDFDLKGLISAKAASPPIVTSSPSAGPQSDLAALLPRMVSNIRKLWKTATLSLKQAAIVILKTTASVRNGALADFLQNIEDLVADSLKPSASAFSSSSGTTSSSATPASLQIEALSLLTTVTETNATSVLLPFVIALIPSINTTVRDRNYKVSGEALLAIESIIKSLTPPRLPTTDHDQAMQLEKLYEVVLDRVTDNNADLEVRHRGIQVFGVLLARTSATKLISGDHRAKGLQILAERVKNETTRLSGARAIAFIAECASPENPIVPGWIREVSIELGSQLRKSDRALRGSCLDALKSLALNPFTAEQFDTATIKDLSVLLVPLLTVNDLHLLTPALIILAKIIPSAPEAIVDANLIKALEGVAMAPLVGAPLKAYLLVVKVIGEKGQGGPILKALLGVGIGGDINVVGRAIGTLVVFADSGVGVGVPDFLNELNTTQDVARQCLALAVLGEIAFRAGVKSPVEPDVFIKSLTSEHDKVRLAAACALGSAGANNIPLYLPLILGKLGESSTNDYLLLHALKELLQHPDSVAAEVAPYADQLWKKLFAASDSEDSRAVGAECIGKLALIEPATYVPQLQNYLENPNAIIRGTVMTAFRYTLADTSESYNNLLRSSIIPFLTTMLHDSEIANRRIAVTTLNSAIHNKTAFILPELGQLLPPVIEDSNIKPELIRVVSFGPFKINVDDGLDLRKACYETFYALLDHPVSLTYLTPLILFPRIVASVPDDQDVRTLGLLMLNKLIPLSHAEILQTLPALAEKFRSVLSQKPKENAVKQEIEKMNEAARGIIKVSLECDRAFPNAGAGGTDAAAAAAGGDLSTWRQYVDWMKKDFAGLIRGLEEGREA